MFTVVLIISSCSNGGADSKDSTKSKSTDQDLTTSTKEKFELPKNFYKRFIGKIDNYPITMEFIKMDTVITGSYYYNNKLSPLSINGKHLSGSEIVFTELSPSGSITGQFSGEMLDENTFIGTWTNPSKSKSFSFKLIGEETQIKEISQLHREEEKCHIAKESNSIVDFADTLCSEINLWNLEFSCKNPEITKKIKSAIDKEICNTFGERKNSVDELFNLLEETDHDFGFSLEIICSVNSIYKNILSVEISTYSYSYGAAHPLSGISIVNFNLSTGDVIEIDDIIKPKSKGKFSSIAEKIFVEKHGGPDDGWDFQEDVDFELADNFTIKANGIHFSYNQYEIGSYAQGMPGIFIPYEKVQSYIDPVWN